jgi:endoglucanase
MKRFSGMGWVILRLCLESALVLSMIVHAGPAHAAGEAYVRLNQVGYQADASKRAYLLTNAAETGATFSVKDASGAQVYLAAIGESRGAWSDSFPFVYPMDFDSVTRPGTYTIEVSGPVPATSPVFKIDTPANLYSFLLSNVLFFFQAQRDGPDVIPTVMNRKPAHLNDRSAIVYYPPVYTRDGALKGDLAPVKGAPGRDVSGGWFDAGDYIKGVMTASYTDGLLLTAVRDFPAQLGSGASADFFTEAKFGARWLMKMWDDQTRTLYYQVMIGDGNWEDILGDHDIWRLPEEDDAYGGNDPLYKYIRNRPVLRAAPGGYKISPNLAGRMTAVFALCYQVYEASDPTFAKQCLLSAEHVFSLANTNPKGRLLTFAPYDYYPESEWRDDLEWGATELYFALAGGNLPPGLPRTDPLYYLRKAAYWARDYVYHAPSKDTLNVYDVSTHAHYELYRAIEQAGNPKDLEVTRAALLNDIQAQLEQAAARANADMFEYGLPYAAWDAVTHTQGLIVVASEYDELTGKTTYADFASHQIGYLFGANAWGTSFIVGAGSSFPKCMQHQVANLSGSLDGTSPFVKGAPVNGPNSSSELEGLESSEGMRACPADGGDPYAAFTGQETTYMDNVIAWPTDEPAIDFAATTPLAFARWIAGLH